MTHQNINRDSVDPQTDPGTVHVATELLSQEQEIEEYEDDYLVPFTMETVSCFRASTYQSPLLPAENKPLETRLLKRVKDALCDVDVKKMAMHITKDDCKV